MGRKTNPHIIRIGNILRTWDAKWFADSRQDYREKLLEDLKIRNYIDKELRMASIGQVEITRGPQEMVLTIHTSRPAVVIGRGGSGIEKLQKDLKTILRGKGRLRINVQEVRNPDTDAAAVATQIVDQLERRMPFRRILKQTSQRVMQAGGKGVRIAMAGRLNGAEIARTEWNSEGNVPLHTFRADISYAAKTALTTYGTIGVKVWINRGELTGEVQEEAKPGEVTGRQRKARSSRGRRSSLADKAKATKQAREKKN